MRSCPLHPHLILALALAVGSLELSAQTIDGMQYTCWSLPEVLRDLQAQGIPVVFSSNLVRNDMQVTTVPSPASPRRLLDQLLHPHGLMAVNGAGGRLLVIQDLRLLSRGQSSPAWTGRSSNHPLPSGFALDRRASQAVPISALPAWVDSGTGSLLVEHSIPGDGGDPGQPELTNETRCLVLRATEEPMTSWEELAFAIKSISVAARARSGTVAVALEASAETTRQLLEHDMAPYIDAYVLSQPAPVPSADPSGRWWWRAASQGETALHTLLQGAAHGAELVLLDGQSLDPAHRDLLATIQSLLTVDLDPQPVINGIAADRAHVLYDPHTCSYYLILYTEPGQSYRIGHSLAAGLQMSCLFPAGASFSTTGSGRGGELVLDGEHRYYLFELAQQPVAGNGERLQVNGRRPVDPYEEVVRNQVFRERQAGKLQSLDVMERRHAVRQGASTRQYTWVHRIIERRGLPTEYHHMGVLINGVRHSEGKLRIGSDLIAEASIELEPLEIELDRTYSYELLGEELVDGHATWKIRFTPLRSGAFLSGTVWLDQLTGARRKISASHTGLQGPLISRELTRYYEWVNNRSQCLWTWTRSTGVSVAGSLRAWTIDTERYRFHINRPDIEEQVAEAHASDIPIHVAVPPNGHRWLIKRKPDRHDKQSHHDQLLPAQRPGAGPQLHHHLYPDLDRSDAAVKDSWGKRVLAGPGKYASTYEVYLRLQDNCMDDFSCSDAGFFFHRRDLLSRGAELFAGVYRQSFRAQLSYPRLLNSDWFLSSWIGMTGGWEEQVVADGGSRSTPILMGTRGAGFGLVRPLSRYLHLRGSYSLKFLELSRHPETDSGFTMPTSTSEHRGSLSLVLRSRKLSISTGVSHTRRSSWEPWGWSLPVEVADDLPDQGEHSESAAPVLIPELAEPVDGFQYAWLVAGFSTRLPDYQSIAVQVRAQKGWHLDHFSYFWAGSDSTLRVAGFQTVRFQEALGASLSYSRNLSMRVPVTFSLEAASLRGEKSDVERLGIRVDSILNGPLKTDIHIRLGYGIYSNVPGEAGKVRSGLILSRRF
jgi:hypothetical protein